jgi:hypothetical protein
MVSERDQVLELDLVMVEHRCERNSLAIDRVSYRELTCMCVLIVWNKRKKETFFMTYGSPVVESITPLANIKPNV